MPVLQVEAYQLLVFRLAWGSRCVMHPDESIAWGFCRCVRAEPCKPISSSLLRRWIMCPCQGQVPAHSPAVPVREADVEIWAAFLVARSRRLAIANCHVLSWSCNTNVTPICTYPCRANTPFSHGLRHNPELLFLNLIIRQANWGATRHKAN